MLLEVHAGQAFVNGEFVEPAERTGRVVASIPRDALRHRGEQTYDDAMEEDGHRGKAPR